MSKSEEKPDHDVVFLHSPTEDEKGVRVLRSRSFQLELAEIRPVVHGQNVAGSQVVRLRPRKDIPFACDVDVLYAPQEGQATPQSSRSSPLKVSTKAYRKNWELVFGRGSSKSQKNPILN